jgi:hypothetical protein
MIEKEVQFKVESPSGENHSTETQKSVTPKKKIVTKKKLTQRERDNEIVTGRFINNETEGGTLRFTYLKHKGDRIKRYEMVDGEIYKVPRCVAQHVANGCWYPVHHFKQTESGRPTQDIGQKKRRFNFIPLDFIMDEDYNDGDKKLVTVKYL